MIKSKYVNDLNNNQILVKCKEKKCLNTFEFFLKNLNIEEIIISNSYFSTKDDLESCIDDIEDMEEKLDTFQWKIIEMLEKIEILQIDNADFELLQDSFFSCLQIEVEDRIIDLSLPEKENDIKIMVDKCLNTIIKEFLEKRFKNQYKLFDDNLIHGIYN